MKKKETLQDLIDIVVSARRAKEPKVSWEKAKKLLKIKGSK